MSVSSIIPIPAPFPTSQPWDRILRAPRPDLAPDPTRALGTRPSVKLNRAVSTKPAPFSDRHGPGVQRDSLAAIHSSDVVGL